MNRILRRSRLAFLVLILLGLAWLWFWRIGADQRALMRVPAVERARLYQRELAAFRELCVIRSVEQLTSRCAERADFLARFPECDSECRALAHQMSMAPTR